MHRSRSGRVVALLLALLASFSAPGAALAHGTAHHREQHGGHLVSPSAGHAVHEHGHAHAEHGPSGVAARNDRPAAAVAFVGPAMVAHDEPDGSHSHPTLDLPVRPRIELAVILPLLAAAALIATPETEVAGGTPVPHAALPRPDPDAAPPPRTRAPPLR